MGRHVKNNKTTKTTKTQEQRRLRDLLDELHSREQQDSAKRAEDILRLIRSRQAKLPTLEDTMTEAQLKRLKPLAWLMENQSYTMEEILMVSLINEQRLSKLRESDLEYNRQLQQRD